MKRHWIETRLQQIGKRKADLARAIDVAAPRITEIIAGTRRLQVDEIPKAAKFLEMPVRTVLQLVVASLGATELVEADVDLHVIYVKGAVQAGAWKDAAEWPDQTEESIAVPAPMRQYPNLYALKVAGLSMNREFRPGTILLVTPVHDYCGAIETGLFVICQRAEHAQFETTVKQLEIKDDRYWLYPRSTEPEHQAPLEVPPPESWSGDTISAGIEDGICVIGIVVGSYRPEIPPSQGA